MVVRHRLFRAAAFFHPGSRSCSSVNCRLRLTFYVRFPFSFCRANRFSEPLLRFSCPTGCLYDRGWDACSLVKDFERTVSFLSSFSEQNSQIRPLCHFSIGPFYLALFALSFCLLIPRSARAKDLSPPFLAQLLPLLIALNPRFLFRKKSFPLCKWITPQQHPPPPPNPHPHTKTPPPQPPPPPPHPLLENIPFPFAFGTVGALVGFPSLPRIRR